MVFVIKAFFYATKRVEEKFKYFKNVKSFKREIKSIFHYF